MLILSSDLLSIRKCAIEKCKKDFLHNIKIIIKLVFIYKYKELINKSFSVINLAPWSPADQNVQLIKFYLLRRKIILFSRGCVCDVRGC